MAEQEGDEFDRLMMALGSVVIMWGMVEDMVRHFLREVVMENINVPEIEQIILSETSFRSQLDILRKVAHVRWPNSDWFNAIDGQIRALKGVLQDKRNRFIHDLWERNEAGQIVKFIRGKDEAAVKKQEGRWQLKLTGEQEIPSAEVEDFFEELANSYEVLLGLKSDFVRWRYEQMAVATQRSILRDLHEKASQDHLSKLASGKPFEDAK